MISKTLILNCWFRVEDLDSESDSRQSSPVKTVKPRVNGHHMSPSKQPKMPRVKEELEEVEQPKANHVGIPNGHSNGDTNGEATIIKASEDNHVEAPMVAAAE